MKTKDFIELVNNGTKPVVVFHEEIRDIDSADPGMMARIIGVGGIDDEWGEGTSTVEIFVDFSEFETHNRTIAQPLWFDRNKNLVKWMDSLYYPEDGKETLYLMLTENGEDCNISYFNIQEINPWFEKYLGVKEKYSSYVEFLENQLELETMNYKINSHE